MSIHSQSAVLNTYSPTTCIRLPVNGDLLVYDSSKKAWINRPAREVIETVEIFTDLLDTPSSYEYAGGLLLMVNETETGIDYADIIDAGSYDDSVPPPPSPPSSPITIQSGYCGNIIPMTFLDLTDTPTSYTGFAGYILSVNLTENSVEFIDIIDAGDF